MENLLARPPGIPVLQNAARDLPLSEPQGEQYRWRRLERAFQRLWFDLVVILVALGAELDLPYERLYAYLQDHLTRRRPNLDLAL